MRVSTALLSTTASIGLLLLGSGPAAAFSVTPSAGATTVEFTGAEAQTITTMNLGPLLGALPPNYTPQAKSALGAAIARAAARAARTPGATLRIVIEEPVATPPGVSVMVTPGR